MKEVLHITIDVVPIKQVSSAMSLGLKIDQNLRLKITLLGNLIHTECCSINLGEMAVNSVFVSTFKLF